MLKGGSSRQLRAREKHCLPILSNEDTVLEKALGKVMVHVCSLRGPCRAHSGFFGSHHAYCDSH